MPRYAFLGGHYVTQELKLADDLFAGIDDGTKRATIRAGTRDIQPDELLFSGVNNPKRRRLVDVSEVKHILLSELTDELAQMDGAADAQEMAEALTRFYPDITADSPITVVLFKLRGA